MQGLIVGEDYIAFFSLPFSSKYLMFLYDLTEAGISFAYVSEEFRHTHCKICDSARLLIRSTTLSQYSAISFVCNNRLI